MDVNSKCDSEEEELDQRKRAACAAVMVACTAVIPIIRKVRDREEDKHNSESTSPDVARDSKRERYIRKVTRSRDKIRMKEASFHHLCRILRSSNLLRDTLYVSVEEQLLVFLSTVGRGTSNRIISRNFNRSGETVSRYFNVVLKAIRSLKDEYIRGSISFPPQEITSDPRYWPWFKDCIGAIDGAHLDASMPLDIRSRIYGKKILAAVNFNLTFSYVLASWEGLSDDSKVLRDVIEKENGLTVPKGKYYLVDNPYTAGPEFIPPYPGIQQPQDLEDEYQNPPATAKELFNRRHSSLRSRMKDALSVLKTRFRLLTSSPQFSLQTQVDTILACCILHNMIIEFDPTDKIQSEYPSQNEINWQQHMNGDVGGNSSDEWYGIRDAIAEEMWMDFMSRTSFDKI